VPVPSSGNGVIALFARANQAAKLILPAVRGVSSHRRACFETLPPCRLGTLAGTYGCIEPPTGGSTKRITVPTPLGGV
jgi:hypothetical protein